jgi:hypothetical protein
LIYLVKAGLQFFIGLDSFVRAGQDSKLSLVRISYVDGAKILTFHRPIIHGFRLVNFASDWFQLLWFLSFG